MKNVNDKIKGRLCQIRTIVGRHKFNLEDQYKSFDILYEGVREAVSINAYTLALSTLEINNH